MTLKLKKCKRLTCHNPPAPRQAYCTRDCAPYGNYLRKEMSMSDEVLEAREAKWADTSKKLTALCAQGKTFNEAALEIALSLVTIKVYARRLGLKFKFEGRGRKCKKKELDDHLKEAQKRGHSPEDDTKLSV